jgi:pimeloyl-ACP methyl ester carboxylesterase
MTGDIAVYLARGEAIRRRIDETVRKAPPGPVSLLGHSLGGIAAVDLLALGQGGRVEQLITVGSQAPFLYEIGALPSLRFGEPLPPSFPNWLNIYDERDLLSYLGAGVFPGRVRDVAVNSRQPFPWSHSAYWRNPEVYRLIAEALP